MKTNFTIATTTLCILAVMLLATSCEKTVPPTVAMEEPSIAVSYDKALMVAEVVKDGGGTITGCGFCYGKQGETLDTLFCPGSENPFSAELPDLSPSTEYTCMAFAVNEAGWSYSELYRFTTMNAVDTVPLVDTYTVKEITHCSAVPSGQVLSGGGQEVMEHGICYGTESLPTVEGMHVAAGSGVGAFECQITGLLPETRYYVRAYAICTKGVYYGDQLNFDTKVLPLEVYTGGLSDVTATRVKAEGKVVRDGGLEVTECGFCWGTEHNPTIEGLHIKVGKGLGVFSGYFSGLERSQTNYVRAYAINEEGVAYGNEVEFIPDDPFMPWPQGMLPGLFSVCEGRQVRFSQGNLQYYPDDERWRFAERQWDFVGAQCPVIQLGDANIGTVYSNGIQFDNIQVGRYYPGWVDLFGWGTSGWNNGNTYYKPFEYAGHIFENRNYGPPGNYDLTGDYAQADWGVHNTISNGGSRQWRTPTAAEYNYLLLERETPSGIRFAMAIVAGVHGMIVLPDDWNESTYYLRAVNVIGVYSVNIVTAGEWLDVLEPAGAVFLPAEGVRYQFSDYDGVWYDWYDMMNNLPAYTLRMWYLWFNSAESSSFYISGAYWTASQFLDDFPVGVGNACALKIGHNAIQTGTFIISTGRANGCSVRLVSDE